VVGRHRFRPPGPLPNVLERKNDHLIRRQGVRDQTPVTEHRRDPLLEAALHFFVVERVRLAADNEGGTLPDGPLQCRVTLQEVAGLDLESQ
jgi:hypothetical protein